MIFSRIYIFFWVGEEGRGGEWVSVSSLIFCCYGEFLRKIGNICKNILFLLQIFLCHTAETIVALNVVVYLQKEIVCRGRLFIKWTLHKASWVHFSNNLSLIIHWIVINEFKLFWHLLICFFIFIDCRSNGFHCFTLFHLK